MFRYYLYRLKLVTVGGNGQLLLPFADISRGDLLTKIIMGHPSAFVRKGCEWIIADSGTVDSDAILFNFGRISRKRGPGFDHDRWSFCEQEMDDVDYVTVFFDKKIQLLAVERKSGAPESNIIAKYISKVINSAISERTIAAFSSLEMDYISNFRCDVESISDPVSFIEYIQSARRITEFAVYFNLPNPYDYDKDLQEPMNKYMGQTDAEASKATVSSKKGLSQGRIVDLTRAAAASGSDAHVKLQLTEGASLERKYLKTKKAAAYSDVEGGEGFDGLVSWARAVMTSFREKYRVIRGQSE